MEPFPIGGTLPVVVADRSRVVADRSRVVAGGSHNLSYQNQYLRGVVVVSIIMIVVIVVIDVIIVVIRSLSPRGGVKIVADDTTPTTGIRPCPISGGRLYLIWVRRGSRFRAIRRSQRVDLRVLYFLDPMKQGTF
jgi:hypothetical protein